MDPAAVRKAQVCGKGAACPSQEFLRIYDMAALLLLNSSHLLAKLNLENPMKQAMKRQ
jgi:hypothetical protein